MRMAKDVRTNELLNGVGGRLAITRQALGLTQTEFARRAGVAQNTYNQIEKGRKLPSVELAMALCDAHGLTLDWIFRDDPSNLRYQTADAIRALRAVSNSSRRAR